MIWSRSLRSSAASRRNALVAARVLGQRRAERRDLERFLAETPGCESAGRSA